MPRLKQRFIVPIIILLIVAIAFAFGYQPDISVAYLKDKYALAPSQFAITDGMQIHFRDEGPVEDGIPLVLLHGTSSSLLTWNACVSQWKATRRVVRLDLPGLVSRGLIRNMITALKATSDSCTRFWKPEILTSAIWPATLWVG